MALLLSVFILFCPIARAGVCERVWGGVKTGERVCSLEWIDSKGSARGLEYRILRKGCTLDSSPRPVMQDCGVVRECDPDQKRNGRVGPGRIRFPAVLLDVCVEGLGDFTLYDFDAVASLRCSGPSAGRILLQSSAGSKECDSGLSRKKLPSGR
ncbi:hypothetical protein EB061_07190 [bacterium]|jgi:hypothetical protein|nr:hypothetical protein [bacterium]